MNAKTSEWSTLCTVWDNKYKMDGGGGRVFRGDPFKMKGGGGESVCNICTSSVNFATNC